MVALPCSTPRRARPDKLTADPDEATGAQIVHRALEEPVRQIAENSGEEGSVVVNKVRELKAGEGLNAATGEYGDLIEAGVIDPTKVTRSALENAASIAKNILVTEAIIAEPPEKEGAGGGMPRRYAGHGRHDVRRLRAYPRLNTDADGTPVPDAMVELWQADADGRYVRPDDPSMSAGTDAGLPFTGFGRMPTSKDGTCVFGTIRPGVVPDPEGRFQAAAHQRVLLRARPAAPSLHADLLCGRRTARRGRRAGATFPRIAGRRCSRRRSRAPRGNGRSTFACKARTKPCSSICSRACPG